MKAHKPAAGAVSPPRPTPATVSATAEENRTRNACPSWLLLPHSTRDTWVQLGSETPDSETVLEQKIAKILLEEDLETTSISKY